MRLADFIRGSLEEIVQAWIAFASSLPALQSLVLSEQENHVRALLLSISTDMERAQSEDARRSKAQGRQTLEEAGHTGLDINSEEHGVVRFGQGMSVPELFSEFRALRASVVLLWSGSLAGQVPSLFDELTRFNEAIDQALSRSLIMFVAEQEKKIKRLDQVLSTIPDHAFVLDTGGRLLYANRALAEHFKLPTEQMIGRSLSELGVTAAAQFGKEIAQVAAERRPVQSEILSEPEPGNQRVHEYVFAPILDENAEVEAVIGTARDITERKLHDAAIWRKANFDALTDLPNRYLFRDRLDHEIRHAERTGSVVALLFIDLDHFKEVNDALGHAEGDRLLQQAAQRIRACTRAEDTVARLGGDEFTVILAGVHHGEDVQQVAQKIVDKLAEPFHLAGDPVRVSGSIGITLYPRDATVPEDMLRNADQAMYVAKNAGRSCFRFFANGLMPEPREQLVADLRQGLGAHEFVLYFQPIVRLQTGRIEKAEALVRWRHPRQGLLPPASFVRAAEDAGLIADIDHWVMQEAARRCAEWTEASPFQISVNPSPLALLAPVDAGGGTSEPGSVGIPPNGLAIELAESVLLQSTPEVQRGIAGLRGAGVQIALEDFGSGRAGMSYLAHADVDYLKIDQGFIKDLLANSTHRAAVGATISLAHELGMTVIAEGVETAGQRDWLLGAGCDYAQGFLFSEALPAEDFSRMLRQQRQTQIH